MYPAAGYHPFFVIGSLY